MISDFFAAAFDEAQLAFQEDEVPVGCVIVDDGKVIARAHNEIVQRHDPTAHAEVLAIQRAAVAKGNERLTGAEMFTTLEPCTMCTGAIIFARLAHVHFLAEELRIPAMRQIARLENHNHKVAWQQHELAQYDASGLLREFFAAKRAT